MRVLPTMDKSANFSKAYKEARGFFDEGMYRKALSKFETALTAAPDEKNIIAVRSWIINCHGRLEQVSLAELIGLGGRADDFCSFSIWRLYVAATSWSQWWYEYMVSPLL